jgi:NTE family protein
MVNPIATPFLSNDKERGRLSAALGSLGIGVGREVLNFYRGIAQKKGDNWPRFNMLLNGIHALMDQEYSGDINIVPSFGWYNPAKILSHLSEKELVDLMEGGEHSAYPAIESMRLCTKISRTMEEILHRFEYGDLKPDAADYHRPRASRRRPPPTRADREAMRIAASQPASKVDKPQKAKTKAKAKSKSSRGKSARKTAAPKATKTPGRTRARQAA